MNKISWTDQTWNPVTGCTPISEGCEHCYARRMHERFSDKPFSEVTLHSDRLEQLLHWKKPRKIFPSMCDPFHEDVPDEFLDKIFAVAALCPQHTLQILTKRSKRMREYFTGHASGGRHIWKAAQEIKMPRGEDKPIVKWPLPNVWLGVTCENQQRADERIPDLLQTPAAVRFVSVEPMLGPLSFRWAKWDDHSPNKRRLNQLPDVELYGRILAGCVNHLDGLRMLDWVICGPETGPGRRTTSIDDIRSLRDQCVSAGVPFHLKALEIAGRIVKQPFLDGKQWQQFPEVKSGPYKNTAK